MGVIRCNFESMLFDFALNNTNVTKSKGRKMVLVSIIVPVYNVEPYLEKCIKSLIEQSYKKLQIILIDDGSTDASGMICDKYAILDNRITVIHQKHQGVSSARNAGLNIAMITSFCHCLKNIFKVIDWMMFVSKELSDEVWDEKFCSLTEAIGMRKLAETVTYMCKKYLGLSEDITWCDKADDDLADELMEYVLSRGNFGRKIEGDSANVLTILHTLHNPISAMKYLTAGGLFHWKAAQKYKILRPFCWIYQIGHIIRKGLSRKEGLGTFSNELKQSNREVDLLKRLEVTRI